MASSESLMVLRVNGIDYEVKATDIIDGNSEILGQVTFSKSVIELRNGLSPSRLEDTLYHEVAHAILYESGYSDHDESLVIVMGNVMRAMANDGTFEKISSYINEIKNLKG